jgi:hypothetical protein
MLCKPEWKALQISTFPQLPKQVDDKINISRGEENKQHQPRDSALHRRSEKHPWIGTNTRGGSRVG